MQGDYQFDEIEMILRGLAKDEDTQLSGHMAGMTTKWRHVEELLAVLIELMANIHRDKDKSPTPFVINRPKRQKVTKDVVIQTVTTEDGHVIAKADILRDVLMGKRKV